MHPSARTAGSLITALLVVCGAAPGNAQGAGAISRIDLSARSSAMGGASNAVFWGEAPNAWGNPAFLGEQQGLAWESQSSQLVPGLMADVHLDASALRLGAGGFGLVLSGRPGGIGRRKLDYGQSADSGPGGEDVGTFGSYETEESWGFGVSAVRLIEAAHRALGDRTRPWNRFGDVSFGMSFKEITISLARVARAEASNRDVGVLARFTPTELLGRAEPFPVRLDLAYGWSRLNAGDSRFVFVNEDLASPASRNERDGFAMRLGYTPPGWVDEQDRSPLGLAKSGIAPLVSFGFAVDRARISAGGEDPSYRTSSHGLEITLANVLSYRRGHYEDRLGDIHDDTEGWGVALPLGKIGGVRYDRGSFPQSTGLPHVTREGTVAWFDPVALWGVLRR